MTTAEFLTRASAAALIGVAAAAAPLPAAAQTESGSQAPADGQEVEIRETGEAASRDVARGCLEEVRAMSDRMNREGYTPAARPMQTLYDAAVIFANDGQAEACQAVVDGMEEFMRTSREPAPMDADMRTQLDEAPPLDSLDQPVQMARLMDAVVMTPAGETLGDIDDVVMSVDGETRYLLIGTGGFLGLGEEYVPVEMSRFRYAGPDILVLDVDPERFQDAPTVDTTEVADTVGNWTRNVREWWQTEVEPMTENN